MSVGFHDDEYYHNRNHDRDHVSDYHRNFYCPR
jgi:hypothetical protein